MRRISLVLGTTLLLLGSCRSTKGPGSPPDPPQTFVPVNTQAGATFAAIKSEKVLQAAMHYPQQDAGAGAAGAHVASPPPTAPASS